MAHTKDRDTEEVPTPLIENSCKTDTVSSGLVIVMERPRVKSTVKKYPELVAAAGGLVVMVRDKSASMYRNLTRSGLASLFALFLGAATMFGTIVWLVEQSTGNNMFIRLFDGLWWSLVTIVTVGYGDKYPQSDIGKMAAILLMLSGVVISAILSGTVASIFVERRIREGKGLQDIRLKGHTIVCGWNRHGDRVLAGLEAEVPGIPVVLVNSLEPERFDAIRTQHPDLDLRFVRGDHTQETILRKASANQARTCVLLPDESGGSGETNADERTILAALALKSLSRDIRVRAGILKEESEPHLRRAGVDDIVLHGEFTGFLLSAAGEDGGLPDAARELLSSASASRLKQVAMPSSLVGKPFSEASEWFMRNNKGVLLGVLTREKPVTLDDILSNDSGAIDAFIKRKFEEAAIDLGVDARSSGRARLAPGPDYLIGSSDVAFTVGGEV